MNIDKATNNASDIQFTICEDRKRRVTEHLASRQQNIASVQDIFQTLDTMMSDLDLEWPQVISVLMDNCNTMRDKKGGVETLIRNVTGGQLLDICGDTVHMLQNTAKAFYAPYNQYVETLCSDRFYNIEEFPKAKELFSEVQSLLNMSVHAKNSRGSP
ncbi:UNVERIFIED_CONTAM: hypothetical protein FKN15_059978 [Acipenser sinensis]